MKLNIFLITCFLIFFIELTYVDGVENVNSSSNTNSSRLMKSVEKINYPKKVTTLKKKTTKLNAIQTQPTNKTITKKKIKPITDIFKNLPEDDFAFIKELDKQFNIHGGKLKIKIENDNSTNTKNSKRTIDGDLGYGYNANAYNNNNGLKYVFYPYSQHDIPPAAPQHSQSQKPGPYYLPTNPAQQLKKERVTEVTIQPSYSYELKSHEYYQDQPQIDLPAVPAYQQHADNYEEPVIVLRIPGPTKYAAHLQALLQQYLEIRAAQYLQILEAYELRKHQQQQQQYEQPQQQQYEQPHQQQQQYEQPHQQQQQYEQPEHQYRQSQQPQAFEAPVEHQKEEQISQSEEKAPTKELHYAPAPADEYTKHNTEPTYTTQELKTPEPQTTPQPQQEHHHTHVQYQHEQQQQQYQQQPEVVQQQPEHYAYYNQVNAVYKAPVAHQRVPEAQYYYTTNTQNLHSESPVLYLVQNQYIPPQSMQPIYVQEHESEQHLPLTENNPRPTHTKVLFKPQKPAAVDHSYMLPTIRPYERHEPVVNTVYQTYYPHHQEHALQHTEELGRQQFELPHTLSQEVIITQRPHKYRSHRQLRRGRRRPISPQPTATTRTYQNGEEQHLRQIRNFVREKFGAETGISTELPSKMSSQK